jgi:hypothetical protein
MRGSAFFTAFTGDVDMDRVAFVESLKRVEPKATVEYQILTNVNHNMNELANLMATGIENMGGELGKKGKATGMSTAVKRMLAIEQGMEPIHMVSKRGPVVKEGIFMLPLNRENRDRMTLNKEVRHKRGRSHTRKQRATTVNNMNTMANNNRNTRPYKNRTRAMRSRSGSYHRYMNTSEY